MKQTITFTRVETLTLEISVMQKLTAKTLADWANSGAIGGISSPSPGHTVAHQVTDWAPVGQTKAKKRSR